MPYCEVPCEIASLISFVFSLFSMQSRMYAVEISTSAAGTRPRPSARGRSRNETTAFSTAASCRRICFCWCGGKTELMRLTVPVASMVCSVESTRWPVAAAVSAVSVVSQATLSPTRMTSGARRSAERRAREEDVAAETAQAGHGVGDIDLVVILELLLLAGGHDREGHGDRVFLHETLELDQREKLAVDPDDGIGTDLDVKVRRPPLGRNLQQV